MTGPIITEKRDLRTGRPVWLDSSGIRVACRESFARERFDTVIVGAGISGAMLAYRLRRKGAKGLVVDRRPPLHGSTAASTALLQFEIDTPLFELAEKIGRDKAERAWLRSVKAVGDLRRLVKRERISCGWRDANTLYLAGDAYDREESPRTDSWPDVQDRPSLGRRLRRERDRPPFYRPGARPSELLRSHGFRRQRHHLFDDRRRNRLAPHCGGKDDPDADLYRFQATEANDLATPEASGAKRRRLS